MHDIILTSIILTEHCKITNTKTFLLEGIISVQENFKAKSSDIFLCSAPKTGTTWLKALAFAIATRNQFDDQSDHHPLLNAVPHDCVPFLKFDFIDDNFFSTSDSGPEKQDFSRCGYTPNEKSGYCVTNKRDPKMPLSSTHLPFSSLPKSVLSSGCKIVYICREPKDMFVSYWHYLQRALQGGKYEYVAKSLTLENEFECFCDGISYYGPYWDHVLGYWKASVDRPDKVLFLRYEDLKSDTLFYVRKLGEFMGQNFSKEEEIKGIVKMCSLENLSNLEVNKSGKHRDGTALSCDNSSFFRKGVVGDWKNLLTPQMQRRIDEITQQKLCGSGFTF